MAAKRWGFCTGYNGLVFHRNRTDRREIRPKNVNQCAAIEP